MISRYWIQLILFDGNLADALVRHRYYCPPDFVRLGNGCYLFSSHITSWQNAHFACRDVQAQLVVFENRWEDSTIRSYLTRPEFGRFYTKKNSPINLTGQALQQLSLL